MRQVEALARAQAVSGLSQGEVLRIPDFVVWVGDSAWPLTEATEAAAQEVDANGGLVLVPEAIDLGVLLTQTCDLQRTTLGTPFCQLAPVIEADPGFVREVSRGRRPGYVWLPWHNPETAIGDLSRITTVERSLLVSTPRLGHPRTTIESLHFAESVSRHFTRAAIPDPVSEVLRPFLSRMKERHDRQSPEGRCIAKVANLRLEGVPDLAAEIPDIVVLLVLDESDLPSPVGSVDVSDERIDALIAAGLDAATRRTLEAREPVELREAWTALAELWLRPSVEAAGESPEIGSLQVEVLNGEELSFARSRKAPELDLAYLTTRAA
jgi:hypothetical protein